MPILQMPDTAETTMKPARMMKKAKSRGKRRPIIKKQRSSGFNTCTTGIRYPKGSPSENMALRML